MSEQSWDQHYLETLGNVPPAISSMFDMSPNLGTAYTRLREDLYEQHEDGLNLETKELIFIILDICVGNVGGACNHLDAARRAGLTSRQLQEALLQTFMVLGVSAWGLTGHEVWRYWMDASEQ